METKTKTLAIIGGGISGICCAKYAKENNFMVTIFEKDKQPCGLWNGDHMWDSLSMNCTKFTCEFSDFEWPQNISTLPNHKEMKEYLKNYIKHYNISDCFQYNSEVLRLEKTERWRITVKDKLNNTISELEYDYVVVATGFYNKIDTELFTKPGDCNIKIMHSSFYKNPSELKDKNVIVVGSSFSSSQICSEICRYTKTCNNLFRKPSFFFSRLVYNQFYNNTVPFDSLFLARKTITKTVKNFVALTGQNEVEHLSIDENSTEDYGVSYSKDYVDCVRKGLIIPIKGEITKLLKDYVTISNNTHQCDVLIYATGYKCNLDFLSEDIKEKACFDKSDNITPLLLYKHIIHTDLPNLGFVGMIKGIFLGTAEMSAKYIIEAFLGNIKIDNQKQEEYINNLKKLRVMRPRPQYVSTFSDFCDDLAKEIGINVEFYDIKNTDEELYSYLMNGPLIMCHYRLYNESGMINYDIVDKIKKVNKVYKETDFRALDSAT
jgi:dimethylaniline monooxygenase (N-oxide forming)